MNFKTGIAAAVISALAAAPVASAEEIKIGVFMGFTGPIESTVAQMAPGAELAIKEVSDSGKLLGGAKVKAVRGDTTCIDSAVATALLCADSSSTTAVASLFRASWSAIENRFV